jgi:hypothetical protein
VLELLPVLLNPPLLPPALLLVAGAGVLDDELGCLVSKLLVGLS